VKGSGTVIILQFSDSNDGVSWYVLGNAYLTLFISPVELKNNYLELSFEAYQKAEENGEKFNPDLHYNRAQLQLYNEEWNKAYESLKLASKLGTFKNSVEDQQIYR
jgi:hypothetical protein